MSDKTHILAYRFMCISGSESRIPLEQWKDIMQAFRMRHLECGIHDIDESHVNNLPPGITRFILRYRGQKRVGDGLPPPRGPQVLYHGNDFQHSLLVNLSHPGPNPTPSKKWLLVRAPAGPNRPPSPESDYRCRICIGRVPVADGKPQKCLECGNSDSFWDPRSGAVSV